MWSPEQYERFKAARQQPFRDLVSLVEPRPGMRVADLGCGTGELTRELHTGLHAAETIGIDSSESMLAKAEFFAGNALRFERTDIEAFAADRPLHLIFSNAAFHWVADHVNLFTRLARFLAPNGQLAVQMPANDSHTSHSTAADLAVKFGAAPRPDHLLPVERYAELLHTLGFKRQHVRMQVYGHLLDSTDDVVEWVRGALLTDYERQLGDRFGDFVDEYRRELNARLGTQKPYFYTYKRILIWATS
jgi:trans-aconitate 2-methyltransferase